MLLVGSESEDIVIPCRHIVLLLSNLLRYYTLLQRVGVVVVVVIVARTIMSNGKENRNVDQQAQTSELGDLYARS